MKTRSFERGASAAPVVFLLAVLSGAGAGDPADAAEATALKIREVYVPYDEFHELTRGRPEGIVMTLEEYRSLVARAVEKVEAGTAEVELPPLRSSVLRAALKGEYAGSAVRFRAHLELSVAKEGWVRCDLGPVLPGLGRVIVDDSPGWIVVSEPGERAAKSGSGATSRMYLLLKGPGVKSVELFFSLPVTERDDLSILSGSLIPACSSRIELTVPGRVEARSEPPFLRQVREGAGTRLVVAAGRAERFRIEWRGRKTEGELRAFLAARHVISYAPRLESPVFTWKCVCTVRRRKTRRLIFREAEGTRLLRLRGELLHSWRRTSEGLEVLLNEPRIGEIVLEGSGILEKKGREFTLSAPVLEGAFSNAGYLALYEPPDLKLTVEERKGLPEVSPAKAGVGEVLETGEGAGVRSRLFRVWSFTSPERRVRVKTALRGLRFETRGAFLVQVGEKGASLRGLLRIAVSEGRLYSLAFTVRRPWKLKSLGEVVVKGRRPHEVVFEVDEKEKSDAVFVTLSRACVTGDPLQLRLELEHLDVSQEKKWERKEFSVRLPEVQGAAASRWDLGVAIPAGMDATMGAGGGWRSLSPEEIRDLGFAGIPRKGSIDLVAGLTTRRSQATFAFTVSRRPPRGEYRAVIHLLALERLLRVRIDLMLTVVDRPVENLRFRIDPGTGPGAVILGDGIKEKKYEAGRSQWIVGFTRPWRGTRRFRIEYEKPIRPETAVEVPLFSVEASVRPFFLNGERFLVLQSRGAVEIRPSLGPGLDRADPDEIPDFADPWPEGRVLRAYRFRSSGDPGTVETALHGRAPVLERLAREVGITTIIGREGVSRSRVEILLAYARRQRLTVELPADARCLSVSVNGDPVRAVILPEKTTRTSRRRVVGVPLPAQSFVTVTITYERPAGGPLGEWGKWIERGPRLRGIPVGKTIWTVCHAPEYRFRFAKEGLLRPAAEGSQERYTNFAETFFARIFSGKLPVFTTFAGRERAGKLLIVPPLTPEEAQGARAGSGGETIVRGRLRPIEKSRKRDQGAVAPSFRLLPEGVALTAEKLGAPPLLELSYTAWKWWTFAGRTVFWGTLLAGWILFLKLSRRAFWSFVLWGVFAGTLLPAALDWNSPLLALPFCEGLFVLGSLTALWSVAKAFLLRFTSLGEKPFVEGKNTSGLSTAGGAFLLALLFSPSLGSAEKTPGREPRELPLDGILIPYDPEALPGAGGAGERVYLPYPKFLELWRLAYPEKEKKEAELPYPFVVGNAEYHLSIEGEGALITGAVDINVLTDRWVTLPLPFERSQLVSVRLDGKDMGVAQAPCVTARPSNAPTPRSVPFIEFKGKGTRKLELTLRVEIHREPGLYKITAGLVAGRCAVLFAELPGGAKVEVRRRGRAESPVPAITRPEGKKTLVTVDLGSADRIELLWSFPRIEGLAGSRVESISFTNVEIDLEGLKVTRTEKIRVTGRPVDAVEYETAGGFEITEVSGADLSEWSVLEDGKERRRLQLFFRKPVSAAELVIRGAAEAGKKVALPTLSLAGAVTQESFVGLKHGRLRKFGPEALSGMRRSSLETLFRYFPHASKDPPDRVYHAYGSAAGETLSIDEVRNSVSLESDIIAVLQPDRIVLSVRSRYTVKGPGFLRHEIVLPEGWIPRKVESETLRSWETVREGRNLRLVVIFKERVESGTALQWSCERAFPALPALLAFPPLRALLPGAAEVTERVRWAFAASDEVDLRVKENGAFTSLPLSGFSPWIRLPPLSSYRFALRSRRGTAADAPGAGITLEIVRRKSVLSAVLVSFARVSEDYLYVNARVVYRIRMAGRDEFKLLLPASAELVSFETRNQRSRTIKAAESGTEIVIQLQAPVAGEHIVDLVYRVPRERTATPVLTPIKVFEGAERLGETDQYVGVLQTGSTFVGARASDGLVPVEAERIPYLPEGISASNLKPTYRATKLDWTLTLSEEEIEIAEGAAAVVELAELSTVVGSDGTARTRAVYTIRNRTLQFLLLELPEGADLWGVALNGRAVSVGEEETAQGRRLLRIPLEYVGAAELSLEVSLKYEERAFDLPALRGSRALKAPRVRDTEVVETIWNVRFPDLYTLSLSGGNMREVAASARYASRVRNLLHEYEKIAKAAKESDSRRVRREAERELRRLEQILSDNLAELALRNRSPDEKAQARRVGKENLESQWRRNDALIEKSRKVTRALKEARKAKGKAKQESEAQPGRGERAFLDAGNFFRQSWRGGKRAKAAPEFRRQSAPGAAQDLETLTGTTRFPGLGGVEIEPGKDEIEEARPKPLEPKEGLSPLGETQLRGKAPGLEAPAETKGCITYSFLRSGGAAELTLTFTRRAAPRRAVAFLLLFTLPAVAFLKALRRRRRS